MKAPDNYSFGYGLFALLFGGILAGFGVFEGNGFAIFGFFIFLFVFLNLLDKATLFKEIKGNLLLLVAYAVALTTALYIFYPYAEHKEALRPFWHRWYIEVIAAAGYAPALILKGLRHFFDVSIPYSITDARTHYPFAAGFWLLWIFLTITVRLYKKMGQLTQNPVLYLLIIYNFILGGILATIVRWLGIAMAGLSVAMWAYIFFPRFGIPTVSKTKWRQREVRKAGKEIQRAQDRMENVLRKIDKI